MRATRTAARSADPGPGRQSAGSMFVVAADRFPSEEYLRDVQEEFRDALPRLSADARRCREAANRSAHELDTDHVGTEHLVVGLFDGSRKLNDALRSLGVTRRLFVETLGPEEGSYPSHHGVTPETVRVMKIVTLAAKRAPNGQDIEPEHLLLGVVDESRLWIETGCGTEGPHHLADAALRLGATLGSIEGLALSLCDASGVPVVATRLREAVRGPA